MHIYGWREKGEETGMEKVLDLWLEREKYELKKRENGHWTNYIIGQYGYLMSWDTM